MLLDNETAFVANASSGSPRSLLRKAGFSLAPGDRVLNRGHLIDPAEATLSERNLRLQVDRAVEVLFNGNRLRTAATTVAELLEEQGIEVYAADRLEPGPAAPLSEGSEVALIPSTELTISVDGGRRVGRTGSQDMAAGLAEAGAPVVGLDTVGPTDVAAKATRIARHSESLLLLQEPIPFETVQSESSELELGLEQVVSPGASGLSVARTRIRYEDGTEIARYSETPAVVRPPADRIVLRGSRVVEKNSTVNGVSIQYWRVLQMYATVYSPCNSGTGDGSCAHGTASGRPAGKGVVAVDPDLFAFLNGQRLYIPGYGFAVVGDVGGGYIVEESLGISRYRWIDLGFDDDNIQDMSGWVDVYFLSPAPPSIPEVLK